MAVAVAVAEAAAVLAPSAAAAAITSNHAPGAPLLLTPASGELIHQPTVELFAISAADPDGDPFFGNVSVFNSATNRLVASFVTSPAPSNGVSEGGNTVLLDEGSYTWTATATDEFGATSAPSTSSFTVAPSPTAGGGALEGSVAYAAPGVSLGACRSFTPTYAFTSAAAAFNSVIVGFVGAVSIRGTGTTCEGLDVGTGTVSLTVADLGMTQSTIACSLSGPLTRVGAEVVMQLTGTCTLNNFAAKGVALTADVLAVPSTDATGPFDGFENFVAAGPFVVAPQ